MPTASRHATGVELAFGLLLAAVLAAVAFLGGGGTDLAPNTWVEVGLLVSAAACAVAVVVAGGAGPRWGIWAVAVFAVLAVLTYASISWSVVPSSSWVEANRTLSYLAAFSCGIALARLLPQQVRGVLAATALATTAVAVSALLAKVFPGTLDRNDPLGRLSAPLGYWNAVGLMAAMGIPPCVWLAAHHRAPSWLRVLCPPAISLLIAVLLLSYSRGSLAVAVIGTGVWFALVPLRLRGAAVLSLGIAGAAVIAAWALPRHSLTADYVALPARTAAGHDFGIVLLVVIAATAGAGVVLALLVERIELSRRTRRRIGVALLGLLALVPAAGLIALARSSRGFTGEISHLWSALTNPNGGVGDKPGRLVTLSNSRVRYWRDGLRVGEHHLLLGSGAGGFSVADQRYGVERFPIRHAHNYLIETFADLGLLGVAISLALLAAWAVASARTLRVRRTSLDTHATRGPPAPERSALLTLLSVVLTFGLHSLGDWTWFIPGTTVLALLCAGWLAGGGSVGALVDVRREWRSLRWPAIGLAVIATVALVAVGAWGVLGPLRADDAYAAAISAISRGDVAAAFTDARRARAADPVSLDPLYLLSELYAAQGDQRQARAELVQATALQPQNPSPWQMLGSYDLAHGRRREAARELERARALAPASAETQTLLAQAEPG